MEQPPHYSPSPAEPADSSSSISSDDRTMAMLCHLAAFAGYIIPAGNLIGPLVLWLIKKDQSPFIDHHGKESVNFEIMVLIAVVVCVILSFFCIGLILLPAVGIVQIVFVIIAAIAANKGEPYRYPLPFRFIK